MNEQEITVIKVVVDEKVYNNSALKDQYVKEKIKDPEIKVFFHERNYGKGHALRTGIEHVTGEIVVIQDADLEYDPRDYIKLIKQLLNWNTN